MKTPAVLLVLLFVRSFAFPVEDVEETASNKADVNAEIEEKFGDFKENCFPKPSGGCSCNEKDADGNEIVAKYDAEAQCKLPVFTETREGVPIFKRSVTEEQARANYDKVVQELKEKFKGLKEGCYPRPKGCLCVVGKNADGRDITERRMKEIDCKCREGEVGSGCPAGA
uniref:Uncharacterized protein n=1 Tax=Plectus sambesii TaxID=2011161 RepID=A0A914XN48_9BILA